MFNRLETKKIKSLEACPLPSKALSFSKILIILCLLFFIALFFIPWQQTSKGHGRVQAYSADEREQAIDAPIDGRLGKWFVQEGSSIKEGDPIVEIYDNDPDFLKRLQTEREAILRKIQANRLGVETSFINVGRQKKLFEEGLSSRKNYEQANLEYTKYLAEEAKS
nr:biotin/lipoyl-binding protein [Bacteriovoracaceae bacterium]